MCETKNLQKGAVGSCQDLNLILNKCQLATVNLWWFIQKAISLPSKIKIPSKTNITLNWDLNLELRN